MNKKVLILIIAMLATILCLCGCTEKKENESIPQISEFEKFMNSEFDDFNAFQSGNTQNKHMHNLYESNLVSSKNEQSGFDLKEALTPTEDLTDIMKIFDLDE